MTRRDLKAGESEVLQKDETYVAHPEEAGKKGRWKTGWQDTNGGGEGRRKCGETLIDIKGK